MAAWIFWPVVGDELTPRGDHLIHRGEDDWNTGYGLEEVSHGQHEWRIKIIKSNYSNADVTIGISSSTDHTDAGFVLHNEETTISYGYCGFNGNKYNGTKREKYAEHFVEGDIIGIRLDIDQGIMTSFIIYILSYSQVAIWYIFTLMITRVHYSGFIAFSRNGHYLGIAYNNIPNTGNIKWRLAVSLCWQNDEVQRLSYVNLTGTGLQSLSEDEEKQQNANGQSENVSEEHKNSKSKNKNKVMTIVDNNHNHIHECTDLLKTQMTLMEDNYSEDKIKEMRMKDLVQNKEYLSGLKGDIDALQIGLKELMEMVMKSENVMNECMTYDIHEYESWDMNTIEIWLYSLEDGRYKKYIDRLIKEFKEDEITADNLPELDRADLRSFGVSNFEDRKDLLKHLVGLKCNHTIKDEGTEPTDTTTQFV